MWHRDDYNNGRCDTIVEKKNYANGMRRDEEKKIYNNISSKEEINGQHCIKYKDNYYIFELTIQNIDESFLILSRENVS